MLHSRNNDALNAAKEEDRARLQATLSTVIGLPETRLRHYGEQLTSVDFAADMLSVGSFSLGCSYSPEQTQNPAPRLSILHALASPSAFLGSVDDAVWDARLSEKLRSQLKRDSAPSAPGEMGQQPVFQEIKVLHELWQSSGKSINLWDWLDGFRRTVAPDDGDEASSADPVIEEDIDNRLHALFIRFVEEARLFGIVRARGKNTTRGGDEVVKGVVMS